MRTSYKLPDGTIVGIGEISSLPGCSQVGVYHSAFVLPQHRGNGHGKEAHIQRLEVGREALYDYALCTVASDNSQQIQVLQSTGWELLDNFKSSKTGHLVFLYGRTL